jgi:hypothetical protein
VERQGSIRFPNNKQPIESSKEYLQEEPSTNASPDKNIDITSWVSNVKVFVPLIELTKVSLVNTKLKMLLGMENTIEPNQVIDINEVCSVVFQVMTQEGKHNGSHLPFFILLLVHDLILYNCMLDSNASTNFMSLKVMN